MVVIAIWNEKKLVHSYLESEKLGQSYLYRENTVIAIQSTTILGHIYLEPETSELQLFRD